MRLAQPGFRVRVLVLATTLLDPVAYPPAELANLYRMRWNAELDLRSLKQTLQMDVLRCKTLELVRKELWTHILAYNLIRTIIAQAAHKHDLQPRAVSFKGAVQTLEAFQSVIALQGEHDAARRLRQGRMRRWASEAFGSLAAANWQLQSMARRLIPLTTNSM